LNLGYDQAVSTTGIAQANGIELCFETFGDPADPSVLLVMGTGVQMTEWEPEFVAAFVDRGFHVVRYDHRDVGLSTRFESGATYTLHDMADDAIGLLDALGIEHAHIVGASMGGMVAQCIAISHPQRVASLCSIMSTTGAAGVGTSRRDAREAMTAPRPSSRDGVIEVAVERAQLLRGGGFPFDEEMIRRRAAAAYDRAEYPEGRARHVAAILATGDRTEALRSVGAPTVVIHGAADPLVHVSGGGATAAAIPGASLVVIPGMGHEFPTGARPLVVDAVVENAARVVAGTD
jgi:pimeloyl-ACP methyl ester carboxylesterase